MPLECQSVANLSDVDWRSPLVASHPLNQGRVAWWIGTPKNFGSREWYDLVNSFPMVMGTFLSGFGWISNANVLCGGSLSFDGSGSVASFTNKTWLPQSMPQSTCRIWLNPTIYFGSGGGAGPLTATGSFQIFYNGGNVEPIVTTLGASKTLVAANSLTPLQTWSSITMVFNNPTLTAYFNGGHSSSILASGQIINSGKVFDLGSNAGANEFYKGYINDISLWSRALSPAEVWQDYSLAPKGYPGVLRHIY